MKLKTIRVRRSHPSTLAMALALMLTMLCVYILSLSGLPQAQQASAPTAAGADVYLPGLEAIFHCAGRYASELDARMAAAQCAQSGGAGLILPDGDQYAVISHCGDATGENTLIRRANALTLRISGTGSDVQAISDAAALLQALHSQTALLSESLQNGDTDAPSMAALLNIYRTQAREIQSALISIETGSIIVSTLLENIEISLSRLENVIARPDPGRLRLMHAAACADWIDMLDTLASIAQ